MKVILLQDVKKVGKKGEIVEVSDGYARNFLMARKLAVMATGSSMDVLNKQNAQKEKLDQENREKALEVKKEIEKQEFIFKVKAKDGKVFNSISSKQVAEELNKAGYAVDKRKIIDNEPITQLGYNKIKVELYKDVVAQIKIKLVED